MACSSQAMINTRKGTSMMPWALTDLLVCRNYQRQLELAESHLQTLQSETNSALDLLGSLTKSFKDVEAQTTNFQKQCEGLLEEQQRIEGLANELDYNLKFYNFLEPVTRRLNAPGAGSFVRSQEFSEMLARIDDCLEYMTNHVRLAQSLCKLIH